VGLNLMKKFYNATRINIVQIVFNFCMVQPQGAAVNNFVIQLALSLVGQLFNHTSFLFYFFLLLSPF
jgi:hypothetical protein